MSLSTSLSDNGELVTRIGKPAKEKEGEQEEIILAQSERRYILHYFERRMLIAIQRVSVVGS